MNIACKEEDIIWLIVSECINVENGFVDKEI